MEQLISLMQQLRHPETGCSWDIKQNHTSLLPYLVEECYELVEAIQSGDKESIEDELGDVLFQIVFHSQIASENKSFDFDDVVAAIVAKMKRRHPHVFAGVTYNNAEAQAAAWDKIKQTEKKVKPSHGGFADVSLSMPTLMRAEQIQREAAKKGFDWPGYEPVVGKIQEELQEVIEVLEQQEARSRLVEEVGDLLFAVTNLARHLKVDSETALVQANSKFSGRFLSVLTRLENQGLTPEEATLEEMDRLWEEVKEEENRTKK